MKIAVDKIARDDFQSTYVHGPPEVDHMGIRMRHHHIRGKQLKTGFVDLGDITHASVGHQRNAPECLQNMRVDRANEGP